MWFNPVYVTEIYIADVVIDIQNGFSLPIYAVYFPGATKVRTIQHCQTIEFQPADIGLELADIIYPRKKTVSARQIILIHHNRVFAQLLQETVKRQL